MERLMLAHLQVPAMWARRESFSGRIRGEWRGGMAWITVETGEFAGWNRWAADPFEDAVGPFYRMLLTFSGVIKKLRPKPQASPA
jgi:hypothetical protein